MEQDVSLSALEVNRALLHHQPIRPIDIIYSRILLEFSGSAGAFVILYLIFVGLGICAWPADLLDDDAWLFSCYFVFVCICILIMAALAELSETIETCLSYHSLFDVAILRGFSASISGSVRVS